MRGINHTTVDLPVFSFAPPFENGTLSGAPSCPRSLGSTPPVTWNALVLFHFSLYLRLSVGVSRRGLLACLPTFMSRGFGGMPTIHAGFVIKVVIPS